MKKLWIITKNELLRYFISPLAYVYLIAFLVLNGACTFYFGHFFERGQASLEPMFWYQPWLYLLFIPGICMRLWAEEFRQKTVMQIMTQPVATETLVWGKFYASFLFCALALGLTFPFWLTVNILGEPDNAVIALSYLGSLALAGCMLAISQTMSALTKNQVIALVLSVAANLVFFWSGLEFVLSFFRLFLPDYIIDAIASFSFLTHFSSLTAGLLELRDVLFFVSIIILFNFTTVLIVSFKTAGTSGWLKSSVYVTYLWAGMMLIIGFMGFNLLANNLTRGTQIDVTEDHIYTLTPATDNLLKNLPEPVTAKLYYSTILERRNPALRQLFDRIRQLLAQYKSESNGQFDYRIYYPQSLDTAEDRAIADGIQPIPLIDLNQNAIFGLTLVDTLQNKQVIPLFTTDNTASIEQEITSKIYQLSHHKKTVGLLSSLPINGEGGTESMIFQPWEIYNRISDFYNIVDIRTPEDFEKTFDVLMIVHPRNLSDEMVEAIKKYSENYGNILLLLDAATEAERLYSTVNHPFEPSELKGLDAFWGFKYYNEYVVADLENSIMVDATINYKSNPAYTQDVIQFKLQKKNFNPMHPITKNLQTLLMSSASIILPSGDDVYFMPLLQAGKNSSLMPISVVYDGLNPRQILSYFKPDENPKILAAGISGKSPDNPFNLIVVGDTDFLYNSFWTTSKMILDRNYFTTLFNNADFILNSLDYLTNNTALAGLRGKNIRQRAFTDIERQRKKNMLDFKIKEEEIFQKIDETKKGLEEIINKRTFENREIFSADELAVIAGIRQKLDQLRGELGQIRLQTNADTDRIERLLKFINIFALPLLICLVVLIVGRRTKRKTLKARMTWTPNLLKISLVGLLILTGGLVSVLVANRSDIQQYEDRPIFPNLAEKINDIHTIGIKTHQRALTFVRHQDEWKLEDMPEFPIYQERIRHLLRTLISARFYEKKSDKAENLYLFGLQPIEAEDSPNTRIELRDEKDNLVESLEIGTYNIDLGRGSKAAYVKLDNRFQVWLAEADFIILDPNPAQWGYGTLWNLRFGRLMSFNGEENPDKVAFLARDLLNTPFTAIGESAEGAELLRELKLKTEFVDDIILKFYRDGEKILVEYVFPEDMSQEQLNFFARHVKERFLQIESPQWEKIKNDTASKQNGLKSS